MRKPFAIAPAGLVGLALLGLPARALADVPSLDARGAHPPLDPDASLALEPTATPGPRAWNFAAWASYGPRPAVLRDGLGGTQRLVGGQLTSDLVANVGLGTRFAAGLALPLVLAQTGDAAASRAIGSHGLPSSAVGDVALALKLTLVRHAELGGFGLAALSRVTAPTGDTASYAGEGAPTAEVRLLAEYDLIAVTARASAGMLARTEPREVAGRGFGDELPWAVGLSLRPQALGLDDRGRFTGTLESHGAVRLPTSVGDATATSPAWVGGSVRFAPRDVSLLVGAEATLTHALGSPPWRATLAVGWAPHAHDQDGDGVEDDVDQCPPIPEDRDGFEDGDGCPDIDDDDDGVPDEFDRCPGAKEDLDDFEDDDGCPDLDDDRDGIPDERDACPREPGPASAVKRRNGCPVPAAP